MRTCKPCGIELTDENTYASVNGPICKSCHAKKNADRNRKNKEDIVRLMGGKCQVCGYDRYHGALHFHHLDPTKKSKTFRSFRGWSRLRQLEEIENCVLLCSNCHSEVEAGLIECSKIV